MFLRLFWVYDEIHFLQHFQEFPSFFQIYYPICPLKIKLFYLLSPGLVLPWRWLAVAGEIPVVIMMILLCFMPTSPRYHIMKGNRARAVKSLEWLRGSNSDYLTEFNKIERSINSQVKGTLQWITSCYQCGLPLHYKVMQIEFNKRNCDQLYCTDFFYQI